MTPLVSILAKRANATPYAVGVSPEYSAYNQAVKAKALRMVLRAGLLGGGAGVGTALLTGWLGRKKLPVPEAEEPDVDLPYPQLGQGGGHHKHKAAGINPLLLQPAIQTGVGAAYGAVRTPEDRTAGGLYGGVRGLGAGVGTGLGVMGGDALAKLGLERLGVKEGWKSILGRLAGQLAGGFAGHVAGEATTDAGMQATVGPPPWEHHKKSDWADSVVKNVLPTPVGEPRPTVGSPAWMRGDSHSTPTAVPWTFPAIGLTAAGGLYGGYHLVRHFIKRRRKAQLDAEVEAAKKEYEEAMLGQYDPSHVHALSSGKTAAAPNRLDGAFEAMQKVGYSVNDFLGQAIGSYGLGAGPLTGLVGVGVYRYLHDRSKAKMLERAMKQRAVARAMANPSDVFLHPVPAHLRRKDDGSEEIAADDPLDPVRPAQS